MKKSNFLFILSLAVILGLTISSCDNSSDEPDNTLDPSNIAGEVTGEVTLKSSETNYLSGALIVQSGGKLTIPAGTVIEAKGGTTSYIAVAQGGQIFVNGTSTDPVIMTSDKKEAGAWGGLVLCGKAPINTGTPSISEVAELNYGGDVSDDNSGSITYLRVEYTGYIYTSEKQFNGVSFFGVGSGTVVNNLVSYMGNDDGIEFFGGTVDASNLLSYGSNDDGIDFADGWSGTGTNWMAVKSKKSGIEGSNNGANGAATPMTDATVKNVTVYDMGEKPWFLKEGAGKQTIDNVVIGGLAESKEQPMFYTSDSTDDPDAKARIDAGDITITNVKFVELLTGQTKAVDGLTVTESESATGAGNGTGKPDWLSDALNTVDGTTIIE
jgi:hypothetical protein